MPNSNPPNQRFGGGSGCDPSGISGTSTGPGGAADGGAPNGFHDGGMAGEVPGVFWMSGLASGKRLFSLNGWLMVEPSPKPGCDEDEPDPGGAPAGEACPDARPAVSSTSSKPP